MATRRFASLALIVILSGCQTTAPEPCTDSTEQCALKAFKPYLGELRDKITRNWVVPEDVGTGPVKVKVSLAPGGQVITRDITKTSGSKALDESVLTAIDRASPLPIPKQREYYPYFRDVILEFKPPKR